MIRLAISVEGETEEEFVKEVLAGHLRSRGIDTTPVLIGRARGGAVHGGGHVTTDRLAREMRHLRHSFGAVTSLVDFYGFKDKDDRSPDALLRAIRGAVGQIDERFVFPHVQVHEFEGLLFSDVDVFQNEFGGRVVADLRAIRSGFETPEDINDSSKTAPSKRIQELIPTYRKTLHGPLLADDIGLDRIRSECPRFDAWLRRVESLGEPAT